MDIFPPGDEHDRADRRALAWCIAGAAAIVTWLSLWNPLNVELGWSYGVYVWSLGLTTAVAVVAGLRQSFRRGILRDVVTVVGGGLTVAAAGVIPGLLFLFLAVSDEQVLASRGPYQLVLVVVDPVDPLYRVDLRRDVGPLHQSVVMWFGQVEGDRAKDGRFIKPQEVSITVLRRGDVRCEYRSRFDVLTLQLDREHRDDARGGSSC